MTYPLVTIIVNSYNRADMVCRALDSVWAQTYRPLELIIVDDGSKDNSMEVIKEWLRKHPNEDGFTALTKTFPNGKLCVARNRGLEMSHGELVQYVDDDDWLYPNCVEKKVEKFFEDISPDVVVHQVDYINSFGKKIGHSQLNLANTTDDQLLHLLDPATETLFSPTLMFKSSIIRRIGAWTAGLVFADDFDIIIRLAIHNARFAIVEEALSAYNMHDQHRQCNKVIYRLPDDFWPNLCERLYHECQLANQQTPLVTLAFAKRLNVFAIRQLRWGRIKAAQLCFDKAKQIANLRTWRDYFPQALAIRHTIYLLEFFVAHLFFTTKKNLKQLIRR